jgi:succinylglutamate desuccinylase
LEFKVFHEIPKGFETIDLDYVHTLIDGPCLFHLKGKKDEPLFVSTLLHGNETTSFMVLQRLIQKYRHEELPRDLIILVGNTLAAEKGLRHLPTQKDFNRVWAGGDSDIHHFADQVKAYAKKQNLFANIDIHNNTGTNPYYGCVNVLEPEFIQLASIFSDKIVYFTEPHEVQSNAFAKICPSVTIEAGQSGDLEGIDVTYNFIEKVLHLDKLEPTFDSDTIGVFHTKARIRIHPDAVVDFTNNGESTSDISFIKDLETKNFSYIPTGYHLGYLKSIDLIRVYDDFNKDVTDQYVNLINNQLITKQMFIPSMFTKDITVMKSDCLGYVMEKLPDHHFE